MLKSLMNYATSITHTIRKADVIKSLDHIFANIDDSVIPTLNALGDEKSLSTIEKSNILKTINRSAGLKAKDNAQVFSKIRSMFSEIQSNKSALYHIVEHDLSDFIMGDVTNARDAAILKVVNDIGGMSLYVMDVNYYVLLDGGETNYPKIKTDNINKQLPSFIASLKFYQSGFSGLIKDLPRVADVNIDVDENKTSMLESLLSKKGKTLALPMSGFTNNPIYHIRMWWVDKEIEKYESLKDKRSLVELKLKELKIRERNESDKGLRKQIEYYEDKLSNIEYEIKNIEE